VNAKSIGIGIAILFLKICIDIGIGNTFFQAVSVLAILLTAVQCCMMLYMQVSQRIIVAELCSQCCLYPVIVIVVTSSLHFPHNASSFQIPHHMSLISVVFQCKFVGKIV